MAWNLTIIQGKVQIEFAHHNPAMCGEFIGKEDISSKFYPTFMIKTITGCVRSAVPKCCKSKLLK